MIIMKSAYLEEKAKINELLNDGFEPFWGCRITNAGKTKTKMYFKKNESIELKSEILESKPRTMDFKIKVDRKELDKVIKDVELMMIGLESMMQKILETAQLKEIHIDLKPDHEIRTLLDKTSSSDDIDIEDNIFDENDDAEDLASDDQIKQRDKESEIEAADAGWDGATTQAERDQEPPAGDAFRVVDDIPPEVRAQMHGSRIKTPFQEEAIEHIRKSNKTNITINPIRDDGVLIVTCENRIYEITQAGEIDERVTNAKTSSIGG